MSGDAVLIDSVILIDHFNGVRAATAYLATAGNAAHISAITRAEVLTGFEDPAARRDAAMLLDRFRFIAIDLDIADSAALLRQQHSWKLPDAIQAAAALSGNLTLVTRNARDFPPERFDWVEVPYTL